MKQEMVPALMDNEARIALDPANPYKIITKPHGHGTSIAIRALYNTRYIEDLLLQLPASIMGADARYIQLACGMNR